MAAPVPPTKTDFVKKTWSQGDLIGSADLDRIENSIDDVHNNNINMWGIKTFDESLWATYVEFNGEGKIRHDGSKLILESQSNLPWYFTRGTSIPTPTGILQSSGLVNGVDLPAHKLRHSIRPTYEPPGEPWNRVYYDIPDPTPKGKMIIVGPSGSACDFTNLQEAIDWVANGNTPWWPEPVTVFLRRGTYVGNVLLHAGVNLMGESWGAVVNGTVRLGGVNANPLLSPLHIVQNLSINATGSSISTDNYVGAAIIRGCFLQSSNAKNVDLSCSNEYHTGHVITGNLVYGGSGGIGVSCNTDTGIGNNIIANNHIIRTVYGGTVIGIETFGLYNRVIGNRINPEISSEANGIVIQPNFYSANPTYGNTLVSNNFLYSFNAQIRLNSDKNLVQGNIMWGYAPGIIDSGSNNTKVDNIAT